MKRGDVVLVRFPHPSGMRGKKRPAVIVQSDAYATIHTFIGTRIMVAQVLRQVAKGMPPEEITAQWRGSVSKEAIKEAVLLAHKLCLRQRAMPRFQRKTLLNALARSGISRAS